MRTLVIHPTDETTDFLAPIYEGTDWTIIRNDDMPIEDFRIQLIEHERIIMLGHGTLDGLLGSRRFIINHYSPTLMRTKDLIGIWCNADEFFKRHKLFGFYTGMMISEMAEAFHMDVECTEEDINESNYLFSQAVRKSIGEKKPSKDR